MVACDLQFEDTGTIKSMSQILMAAKLAVRCDESNVSKNNNIQRQLGEEQPIEAHGDDLFKIEQYDFLKNNLGERETDRNKIIKLELCKTSINRSTTSLIPYVDISTRGDANTLSRTSLDLNFAFRGTKDHGFPTYFVAATLRIKTDKYENQNLEFSNTIRMPPVKDVVALLSYVFAPKAVLHFNPSLGEYEGILSGLGCDKETGESFDSRYDLGMRLHSCWTTEDIQKLDLFRRNMDKYFKNWALKTNSVEHHDESCINLITDILQRSRRSNKSTCSNDDFKTWIPDNDE